MDFNTLITNNTNKGAGLHFDVAHSFDGTHADVVVFDAEGSFVSDITIADVELDHLKETMSNATFS